MTQNPNLQKLSDAGVSVWTTNFGLFGVGQHQRQERQEWQAEGAADREGPRDQGAHRQGCL